MNYTKEQLNVAKNILLSLISEDRELHYAEYGICWNAFHYPINNFNGGSGDFVVNICHIVYELSVGWKHHTGVEDHPVPDIKGNKWEGKNLELRIDLMKYIINKIDELLETL